MGAAATVAAGVGIFKSIFLILVYFECKLFSRKD
jgi:hypothetical protein